MIIFLVRRLANEKEEKHTPSVIQKKHGGRGGNGQESTAVPTGASLCEQGEYLSFSKADAAKLCLMYFFLSMYFFMNKID